MRYTLILCLTAPALFAQGSVTIFGAVADASGAVLPSVNVTITNTQTSAIRQTKSNDAGAYVVSQLSVGTYSVKAEAAGFKTFVQEGIQVQVDENRQVNIAMAVGSVSESIEV